MPATTPSFARSTHFTSDRARHDAQKATVCLRLLAAASFFLLPQQAAGETCRPSVQVKDVRFSETVQLRRTWSAAVDVDASRCSTDSGVFKVRFIRLKENGVDLPFTETFTWRPGAINISVEFWADEAPLSYSIEDVAPCSCAR